MNLYFYRRKQPHTPQNFAAGQAAKVTINNDDVPQFAVFSNAEILLIEDETVVVKTKLIKEVHRPSVESDTELESGFLASPQPGTDCNYKIPKAYIW